MLYFWNAWCSRIQYDIPICQSHSTQPQPIQRVPTMQKSSLRHHFRRNSWKLDSQNLQAQAHFWCACKFSFFPVFFTPMGILGKNVSLCATANTQKMDPYRPKMAKRVVLPHFRERALDKTRILAPSHYFYHFSFSRYGRLKSKFLCERYSHCIFCSWSIELTKTRNTWSLTAVSNVVMKSNLSKGEL